MNILLLMIITAIPAFVLGGINGAIITTRMFYRKDIREYGSGNPGLTNFFRVFGKYGVVLVIFIDVFKTVAPVVFGGWLFANFTNMALSEYWLFNPFFEISLFGVLFAGFFVLLGHCYPIFYNFKGGKGVMTIGTIVIVMDWRLALIIWGIFLLIVITTRYVSLGAIVGCAFAPFVQFYILNLGGIYEFIMALLCVILIIARHGLNIKRLIKGQESKFSLKRKHVHHETK
jgi:glycerol-3-phosphate acyltransferase PlsY